MKSDEINFERELEESNWKQGVETTSWSHFSAKKKDN